MCFDSVCLSLAVSIVCSRSFSCFTSLEADFFIFSLCVFTFFVFFFFVRVVFNERERATTTFQGRAKTGTTTRWWHILSGEEREKNGVHRNVRVSNERRGQRSHRRRVNLARVRDHREQRENDFDDISSGSDFGEHVRDTRQSGGTSENETETVSLWYYEEE